MKISELIDKLQEIRLEEGNLDIWLHVIMPCGKDFMGELDDMYTEERTTLFLLHDHNYTSQ